MDYTAPEQIRGERVDARADVYALGCVLYQMLAEVPPFRKESYAAVVYAHLNEEAPRLSDRRDDLPEEFDEVIARALSKQPGERFQTAGELGAAAVEAARKATPSGVKRTLEELAATPSEPDTDPEGAVPTVRHEEPPRRRRTHWVVVGVAAVLVALVLGLLGTALLGDGDDTVSAAEARAVLDQYAARYTQEDVNGIAALLAPDFERRVAGAAPQSREPAVQRFRDLFSEPQAPRYVLRGMRVSTDDSGATARGRFLGEGNDLYGTGEIEFHLSRHGDRVLIDSTKTVPDINQRIPVTREGVPATAVITVRTLEDGTLPRGTVIGKRAFDIEGYHPERFFRVPLNAAGRRIGRGEPYNIRIELRDRDGRRFFFNVKSQLD